MFEGKGIDLDQLKVGEIELRDVLVGRWWQALGRDHQGQEVVVRVLAKALVRRRRHDLERTTHG